MSSEKIEGIDEIEGVSNKKGVAKANPSEEMKPEVVEPNRDKFESLMVDQTEKVAPIEGNKVEQNPTSLMGEINQLNAKVDRLKGASPQDFVNKAHEVSSQMEDLKTKLSMTTDIPGGAHGDVLRNKLSHIDENLKVSLDRTGVEYSPTQAPQGQTPLQKFLNMLTDSQARLDTLSSDVAVMQRNGKDISPATMIAMQIKVNFIQQEVELFTSLLSKAIESTKTVMNVQV